MNVLKTFAEKYISKEIALYSTIVVAGTVFILIRIFSRKKINKNVYDKSKKKVCTTSKLYFKDLIKKIEVRPKINQNLLEKSLIKNDKYFKMKEFVQKVADSFEKTKILEQKDKDKSLCLVEDSGTKKDQIFYYLLNNVSHMISQANNSR
jgi:hypothetical protein